MMKKNTRVFTLCSIFMISLFTVFPQQYARAAGTSVSTKARSNGIQRADQTNASQQTNALPAPVGYWKFDEATGTTTKDATSYGATGTVSGTGAGSNWTTGKSNSALSFDGATNYVDMGTAPTQLKFGTNSFTVMAWIKITGGTYTGRIVSNGNNSGSPGYYIGGANSSCTSKGCLTGGLGADSVTADALRFSTQNSAFSDSNWHQEAMVIDRTNNLAMMYVDGVAQLVSVGTGCGAVSASGYSIDLTGSTNSACSGLNASGTDHFTIGKNYTVGEYFPGNIDEARVYSSALTNAQIMNQYLQYSRPTPVGYWKFDAASGSTAADSSGNGNIGTNYVAGTATSGTWAAGQVNNALTFGGTNYVTVGTNLSLTIWDGQLHHHVLVQNCTFRHITPHC
jgi:hypothetical protein